FTAVTVPLTPLPATTFPTLTLAALVTAIVQLLAAHVAVVVENVTVAPVPLAVVRLLRVSVVPFTFDTVVFAAIPVPVTAIPELMPVALVTVIVKLLLE